MQSWAPAVTSGGRSAGGSAANRGEPSMNPVVRLQSPPGATCSVKLAELVPMFPARSVAVAEKVLIPAAKVYAGAAISAQVLEAIPEPGVRCH